MGHPRHHARSHISVLHKGLPMLTTTAFSGSLFIVAAPSGAGKSTLVNALLAQEPGIKLSISTTTRAPRPGEQDGREYHFTTADDFVARADRGEFLEWAEVHGNYYGTSRLIGRAGNEDRHRYPAGNRLARRAPGAQAVPGRGRHLHSAAIDRRAGRAPAQARAGRAAHHHAPPAGRRAARSLTLPTSNMLLSTKSSTSPCPS